MSTACMVLFPYSGYGPDDRDRAENFRKIINTCRANVKDRPTVVVLNKDTVRRGAAKAFLDEFNKPSKRDEVDIHEVWSVDSCQMWLAGWGYLLDSPEAPSRIVQVPGDIDVIEDIDLFLGNLKKFIKVNFAQMFVGDYVGRGTSAKDLIDRYGTLPLLANWFPAVSHKILGLKLSKPRSEFLNIDTGLLEKLLAKRKFAYEQTLNMLIRAWDVKTEDENSLVEAYFLGRISDDATYRNYRECIDQIERTERMLRLIWRELNDPVRTGRSYSDFIDNYFVLDQRSTAIRGTAVVTIRNLIK